MESRNILLAITLSAGVLLFWSLFMIPEQDPNKMRNDPVEKTKTFEDSEVPSMEQNENSTKLTRKEILTENPRVQFENDNIFGSISLIGGIVDDLTFKKYDKELHSEEKIILLNPANLKNGYVINSGWATTNKNIDIPNSKSVWKIQSSNKLLSPGNPIGLTWENKQGIKFFKTISIDNKYLFKVKQKIINSSNKSYVFFPFASILRNNVPEDLTKFWILHEGYVTYANEELIEKDYDDIKEEKFSIITKDSFCALTDAYWLASLIPAKGREVRIDFSYKNKYRASFIDTKGFELKGNSSIENEIRLIIGAKTVRDIDAYAKNQNIEKFDLVINWGILYMIVKPMWFALEYFFKLTGNFGYAIILLTICIRLIFFPLNNYSFKSMSRMKLLQPEMLRLKKLHENDKMEYQKSVQKLYKAEGVNPLSGCLPILVTIPFFFALYKLLLLSVEMRHANFIWIWQDLSAKDPSNIFTLFGLLEWNTPNFLEIGILPIAMGVTMFLQQKLNPSAMTDPIQKKIFAFFPLFLTIILAPFASGLVLYWTATNILTIIQQFYIYKGTTIKTSK